MYMYISTCKGIAIPFSLIRIMCVLQVHIAHLHVHILHVYVVSTVHRKGGNYVVCVGSVYTAGSLLDEKGKL